MDQADLPLTDPQVDALIDTLLRAAQALTEAQSRACNTAQAARAIVTARSTPEGAEPADLGARAAEARARYEQAIERLDDARATYDEWLGKLENAIESDPSGAIGLYEFFFTGDEGTGE